uniref:NADH dehydrogenase subunit 4L n=1 Tax=Schistosoma japonicum TaxID=6182 RepID=A0A067Y1B4_SCHJA|nr:NADH dehydrogenase subunit 4L [Schistosoma japonicum]
MLFVILLLGGGLMLISLVICSHYLFNYLIVLESYNVLLLLICLLVNVQDCQVVFISMMASFVLEASIMLIVVGISICHGSLRVSGGL